MSKVTPTPGCLSAEFDVRRFHRDALIITATAGACFMVGVAVFALVSTLEIGGIIAWLILAAAAVSWCVASLRGGTSGIIGMGLLLFAVVNLGIGAVVLLLFDSEVGFVGMVPVFFGGLVAVPGLSLWSAIELFRNPRLRRWQRQRYELVNIDQGDVVVSA